MKKESPRLDAALLVDLLCCLLGSTAVCSVLLPALGQEVGVTDALLFTALDLSLIFLLSRRWWIAPALILAAAFFGFWAVYLFQLGKPLLAYLEGFIDWYNAAYPYTLPYSENGSRLLVHLAFSFPVVLALYVYFRRLPFLPLWVLLSGGVLFWMDYSGSEGMLTVAALLLIVLIVLIARTNARSIKRRLGGDGKKPSSSMQVTALALAPLVVIFAFALGPKSEGAWQSKSLVHLVEDLRDVFSFYGEGSSGSGSFDLGYSGLAPNGFRLGGDIDPNNKPVMRVKTSTPILLAGAVYDAYDGRGWYDAGALGRFRFSSPLWRGKRREVFTIDKPASGRATPLYTKLTKSAVLEIGTLVTFRSFFAGGKLEKLTLRSGGDDSAVYFNTQGELYLPEAPASGVSYTIRTRVFDRDREGFDGDMRLLLEYAGEVRDREYEEILQRNTWVPDTLEPFVRDLALALTEDCDSAYDKALAIETWIRENCVYTKTPGPVPEDRDFVSYFLETREGYCTYYATAMTLLARLAGLPARYVTGYGLKQGDRSPETTSYIATNATAHAWSQVYFYGVGWVDFDPSSWNFHEPVEKDPPVQTTPKPQTQVPVPELPEPELPEPELPEEPQSSGSASAPKKDRTGRILLIVLGCDLGLLLLFLLVRFILLFFRMESFYYRLKRRYGDNAARADECYRQILRQLAFLGLEPEPRDTMTTFTRRADETLSPERVHEPLQRVCEPVLLSRFAGRQPTDGEVRRLCGFYIYLERELRRKLGMRKYILRRMLLGR